MPPCVRAVHAPLSVGRRPVLSPSPPRVATPPGPAECGRVSGLFTASLLAFAPSADGPGIRALLCRGLQRLPPEPLAALAASGALRGCTELSLGVRTACAYCRRLRLPAEAQRRRDSVCYSRRGRPRVDLPWPRTASYSKGQRLRTRLRASSAVPVREISRASRLSGLAAISSPQVLSSSPPCPSRRSVAGDFGSGQLRPDRRFRIGAQASERSRVELPPPPGRPSIPAHKLPGRRLIPANPCARRPSPRPAPRWRRCRWWARGASATGACGRLRSTARACGSSQPAVRAASRTATPPAETQRHASRGQVIS